VPVQLRSELLDLPYRCDPGFRGERDDGRRESRPGEPCEPADLSIPGALVNADRGIVLALDIEHQPVSASTGRLDLQEREDARRDAATTVLRLRGHASVVSGTGQHEYGTGSDDARSVDGDLDPDEGATDQPREPEEQPNRPAGHHREHCLGALVESGRSFQLPDPETYDVGEGREVGPSELPEFQRIRSSRHRPRLCRVS